MRRHFAYLKYVLRHKWFVFVACRHLRVSLWRSIIHDWSKFLPCEWTPYVNEFYGDWRQLKKTEPDDFRYWSIRCPIEAEFQKAWNHHQKSNKHHWQYWLLTNDSDTPKHNALQMPDKYVREMVADWWGAGRAISGLWDAPGWYEKHKEKILISERTREDVELFLDGSRRHFINKPDIATTLCPTPQ